MIGRDRRGVERVRREVVGIAELRREQRVHRAIPADILVERWPVLVADRGELVEIELVDQEILLVQQVELAERRIQVRHLAISRACQRGVAGIGVGEALVAEHLRERRGIAVAQPLCEDRRVNRLRPIRLPIAEAVGHLHEQRAVEHTGVGGVEIGLAQRGIVGTRRHTEAHLKIGTLVRQPRIIIIADRADAAAEGIDKAAISILEVRRGHERADIAAGLKDEGAGPAQHEIVRPDKRKASARCDRPGDVAIGADARDVGGGQILPLEEHVGDVTASRDPGLLGQEDRGVRDVSVAEDIDRVLVAGVGRHPVVLVAQIRVGRRR
ncbi:hypothetical protein D9M73_109570 [compost metagenome]